MGHEIRFETYPTSINTKKIAAEIDDYAKHATWGEGGGGLPFPIRWLNETYDTREEAEEAIERRCTNSYDELAVKFYERPRDYKPTQAYTDLEERLQAARKRERELSDNPHFANIKAEYVGCPGCGSKIARKYLKGNYCPVCHADMRPVSTLDAIKRAGEKVKLLEKQMADAKKKEAQRYKSKATLMWLVRYEYHV